MTDSEKSRPNQDIELIKKALLEEEEPEIARKKYAKLCNLMKTVIPLDAAAIKEVSAIDWEKQKNEAVRYIREAASRLADPLKAGETPIMAEAWEESSPEERAKSGFPNSLDLSNPEILERCVEYRLVSYALDQIASAISKIPGNKFRPYQAYELLDVDPSNIGTRGGGPKKPDLGRTKALLVKELDEAVPTNIENRYAVIARLAQFRDPTITRNYVRSTIKKGHT